jgi:hypothetical protein
VPLAVKQHDNTELYSRGDEKYARVQGPQVPHIIPFGSNACQKLCAIKSQTGAAF